MYRSSINDKLQCFTVGIGPKVNKLYKFTVYVGAYRWAQCQNMCQSVLVMVPLSIHEAHLEKICDSSRSHPKLSVGRPEHRGPFSAIT